MGIGTAWAASGFVLRGDVQTSDQVEALELAEAVRGGVGQPVMPALWGGGIGGRKGGMVEKNW